MFSNFNVLNADERVTKLNKLFNDLKINNYSIASEVENSLGSDLTLNNLCITQFLSSTDIDFTSEGEKPLGICKLTYNVRYMNSVTNSTTPL